MARSLNYFALLRHYNILYISWPILKKKIKKKNSLPSSKESYAINSSMKLIALTLKLSRLNNGELFQVGL
jgi:hypothetical protein